MIMNDNRAVAHRRQEELLAQIEEGVHDDTVSLSSLLNRCVLLGDLPGAENLLDWARQELDGYVGADDVPRYRHIGAPLMAVITNLDGFNPITQRIERSIFPRQVYEMIAEKVDLEDATLGDGLGMLEALAKQDVQEHKIVPYWGSFIAETLNKFNAAPNSRVAAVYWSVPAHRFGGFSSRPALPWLSGRRGKGTDAAGQRGGGSFLPARAAGAAWGFAR